MIYWRNMSNRLPPSVAVDHGGLRDPALRLLPLDESMLTGLDAPDDGVARILTTDDQQWLKDLRTGDVVQPFSYIWGVHAAQTPDLPAACVGIAALHHIDTKYPEAGVVLFRQDYTRRRLGTLAFLGMSQLAFDAGAEAVEAHTLAANIGARLSLTKVGFVQVPRSREEMGTMTYGDGKRRAQVTDWMVFNPDSRTRYRSDDFAGLGDSIEYSRQAFDAAIAGVTVTIKRPLWLRRLFG